MQCWWFSGVKNLPIFCALIIDACFLHSFKVKQVPNEILNEQQFLIFHFTFILISSYDFMRALVFPRICYGLNYKLANKIVPVNHVNKLGYKTTGIRCLCLFSTVVKCNNSSRFGTSTVTRFRMPETSYTNGFGNGHMPYDMEDGSNFLFTSESVGEGHPGEYILRFHKHGCPPVPRIIHLKY